VTSQDEGTLRFFIPSILCVIGNKLPRRHIYVAVKTLDYNREETPVGQAHELHGAKDLLTMKNRS
jgi:hypothetical protein